MDSALFVNLKRIEYSILIHEFYRKIENIVLTFKHFFSLQAMGELMNSTDHCINIQLPRFISCCFDLHNHDHNCIFKFVFSLQQAFAKLDVFMYINSNSWKFH